MTNEPARTLVDELEDVLEREREALLTGQMEALVRLAPLKERLLVRMDLLKRADRVLLGRLQKKIDRNQILVLGTLEGLRSVSERMKALNRVRSGLAIYDHAGHRRSFVNTSAASVERRM